KPFVVLVHLVYHPVGRLVPRLLRVLGHYKPVYAVGDAEVFRGLSGLGELFEVIPVELLDVAPAVKEPVAEPDGAPERRPDEPAEPYRRPRLLDRFGRDRDVAYRVMLPLEIELLAG